ncbi:MAG: hypothetical protein ACPGUV_11490 [Polyangiales bacterium]
MLTMVVALPEITDISHANGMDAAGNYHARGWLAADGLYFVSFVQAFLSAGQGFSHVPFCHAADNRYALAIHAALAWWSQALGGTAPQAVARLTPWCLLAEWAMLAAVLVHCARRQGWSPVQGLLFSFVASMAIIHARLDFFTYTQTQPFALLLLFVLAWLCARRQQDPVTLLAVLGLLAALVWGHAVTSVAGLALVGAHALRRLLTGGTSRPSGVILLAGTALLGLCWLHFNQHPFPNELHEFSWRQFRTVFRMSSWGYVELAALLGTAALVWRSGSLAVVSLLACYYLYLGRAHHLADDHARWFGQVNAPRLIYLALILAFWLLPQVRVRKLRRFVLPLLVVCATWAPKYSAMRFGSASLKTAPPMVITSDEQRFLSGVAQRIGPTEPVLSLLTGHALAAFTGRPELACEPNLWALGMIKREQHQRQWDFCQRFWQLSARQRADQLRMLGVRYLALRADALHQHGLQGTNVLKFGRIVWKHSRFILIQIEMGEQ